MPGLFQGKDKAWWYGSYSGERIRRFLSLTGNVPSRRDVYGTHNAMSPSSQSPIRRYRSASGVLNLTPSYVCNFTPRRCYQP